MASGIGLGFPHNTFLLSPSGLFSDFVRVIYSYEYFATARPNSWIYVHVSQLLPGLADLFERYRSDALLLFAQNPKWPVEHLTHFHHPPVTQIYSLLWGRLMVDSDPFTTLGLAILISFLPLAIASILVCRHKKYNSAVLFGLTLFSYPALFSLSQGNLTSILSASLLILSVILVGHQSMWPAILSSVLALSIRPNWYPVLLLLLFAFPARERVVNKVRWFIAWLAAFFTVNLVALQLSHAMYPAYTLDTFLKGYKNYSSAFEFGKTGLPFGSSLLGAQKLLLSLFLDGDSLTLFAVLRRVNIILASAAVVWVIVLVNRHRLSKERALLISVSLTMLGTPVLADYHLLAFWGVIFYAIHRAKDMKTLPLSRLDLLVTAIMLAPFAYYFRSNSITGLGVLIRPLIALAYVIYCFFLDPLRQQQLQSKSIEGG